MHLAGKHILDAAPSRVWAMLMDTDTLAKLIPGISRLEKTGENSYRSILDIRLGPVNSSFTGQLNLENIKEPESFTLKVQQNSKIGNANANITINLTPVDFKQTGIVFEGDARLSGLIASMGERVLSGVSNTLVQVFFKNMEKELANTGTVQPKHSE
ncbi:MAG TPA: carbon monoxide dehydrogenase subunit G [Chitinophagaceae bacterium]|nr:carbon monoxide dehydrogenase subunit G [Chitinophagaceae bacterium]